MKHLPIYLLLSLLHWGSVSSQTINLLKRELLHTTEEQSKINLLLKIGQEHEKKDLDSAIYYYKKTLTLKENANDTLLASIFSRVGGAYLLKGNYDVCLDYQLKALKIYEEHPYLEGKLKVYNNIALVYFYQEQYDKALTNFNFTEKLVNQNGSKNTIKSNRFKGKLFNNIGIIYASKKQFDLALEYFSRAATFSKKAHDFDNLASLYANSGLIYIYTKRFELAEAALTESLQIRQKEKNLFGLCKSNHLLGMLFKNKGNLKKAEQHLLTSLQLSQKTNSLSSREEVLKDLSSVMSLKGDYKKAYQYQIEFKAISDSLFNKKNHQKIIQAEMQYNFDKASHLAKTAQKQNEFLLLALALFLSLIIIIVMIMYRLQKSKAKIQQLAKETAELSNKEFLLREYSLQQELELKSKELTTNIIYLLKKNELIQEISNRLKELKKQVKKEDQETIKKIIDDLKNAQDENVWKEFEVRFNQVYNDFYDRLKSKYPDLTVNEKRICGFLRLNMTSKEICALTRQSYNSLNVARARLRKKLNIQNEEVNLVNFLENL
ncbi:MAG: tetratricopeptide repeat protein [Flavobacterium sp.]